MANAEVESSSALRYRTAVRLAMSPVLRAENINSPEYDGLAEFERLLTEESCGGVVIFKHFSFKDPPLVVKQIAMLSKVLKRRKIILPTAAHHIWPGEMIVANKVEVKVDPIVTENTVKRAERKGQPKPELGEGNSEFLREAVETVGQGGLLFIAPEGERKSTLEPYFLPHKDQSPKRPIGFFMAAARKAGVSNIAFLFVDLRLAGRKEGYWDKSWFNPLNKYEVRIGRVMKYEDVMRESGGKAGDVDERVIFPEMQRAAAIKKADRMLQIQ